MLPNVFERVQTRRVCLDSLGLNGILTIGPPCLPSHQGFILDAGKNLTRVLFGITCKVEPQAVCEL